MQKVGQSPKPLAGWRRAVGSGVLALGLIGCASYPEDIRPVFSVDDAGAFTDRDDPMERGRAYFSAGQFLLALDAFKDTLAADPGSVRALAAIAATYDRLGRFELADRFYRRALEIEPNSVQVLNNLGYSQLMRGDRENAKRYLRQAAELDAENPVVQSNLALASRDDGPAEEQTPPPPMQAELPRLARDEATVLAGEVRQPLDPEVGEPHKVRLLRVARGVQELRTQPEPTAVADADSLIAPFPVVEPAPQAEPAARAAAGASLAAVEVRIEELPQPTSGSEAKWAALQPADAPAAVRRGLLGGDPLERLVAEIVGRPPEVDLVERTRAYVRGAGIELPRVAEAAVFGDVAALIAQRLEGRPVAGGLAAELPVWLPPALAAASADVLLLVGARVPELQSRLIALDLAERDG